jgi:exonuclease VII small subunit
MRMNKVIMLVAPLTLALTMTPAARAERGKGPCRQDVQKLCPDAKPGGGALRDCLKQHAAELSPACQEHLKQVKAKVAAWQQACQDDVQKFCASVQPGHANILKCLHEHNDQLSKSCQEQMAQARKNWHRHRAAAAQPATQPSAQ